MVEHVVIEDSTGERATVAPEAAEIHKLRGFTILGPAVAPGDPRTVDEAAQEAAQRDIEPPKRAADKTTSKKEK